MTSVAILKQSAVRPQPITTETRDLCPDPLVMHISMFRGTKTTMNVFGIMVQEKQRNPTRALYKMSHSPVGAIDYISHPLPHSADSPVSPIFRKVTAVQSAKGLKILRVLQVLALLLDRFYKPREYACPRPKEIAVALASGH